MDANSGVTGMAKMWRDLVVVTRRNTQIANLRWTRSSGYFKVKATLANK